MIQNLLAILGKEPDRLTFAPGARDLDGHSL